MNKPAEIRIVTFMPTKTTLFVEGKVPEYINSTPEEVSEAVLRAIKRIAEYGYDISKAHVEIKRWMIVAECFTEVVVTAPLKGENPPNDTVQQPEARR